MFALQVLHIELLDDDYLPDVRNIFLDISSEGQKPRRFFMGNFANTKKMFYESIVHYTNGPVVLNLNYGPLRYHLLGVSTVYIFLEDKKALGKESYLPFGKHGAEPLFRLCYIVYPVSTYYQFSLNEVSCLRQITKSWRKDHVIAEIEMNHSPHSIEKGPRNRYNIGRFNTHDIASMYSSHNMSFTFTSNAYLTLYSKTLLGESIVGTISFTPLIEVLNNLSPYKYTENQKDEVKIIRKLMKENTLSEEDIANGGLLMFRRDFVNDTLEFILSTNEKITTQKINLSGESGGVYECIFTIKKCDDIAEHIFPKTLLSNVRNSFIQLRTEDEDFHNTNSKSLADEDNPFVLSNTRNILSNDTKISSLHFSKPTSGNHVEVLIDGLATFKRYYEIMMRAKHSINIIGWEISLAFGLIVSHQSKLDPPKYSDPNSKWITLEDLIVSKAKEGVKIKIIVWRHELISYLTRYMYLGEITIEKEVAKLEKRCKKLDLKMKVFHSSRINREPIYADPFADYKEDIMIVIAGNPQGLVSSHHEKLVLIDPECQGNTYAFTGGFDIARGRFDQPLHLVPRPERKKKSKNQFEGIKNEQRYTGRNVQPVSRKIRFLWHDIQVLIKGPTTRLLHLHFAQRWSHSFTMNPNLTKEITLPNYPITNCLLHDKVKLKGPHSNCVLRLERTWRGVFDINYLFDDYCRMIKSAGDFLYIEHQYPFQIFSLTYYMCEALKSKPNLKVIIVTPIKTDLPSGIVGEIFDWSQDHIIDHLQQIYLTAPDRVGIYGLANQDPDTLKLKSIYVHSKLVIVDDKWILTGSTNMDNISFFYSSELSLEIHNPAVAKETRIRLMKEHLGKYYQNKFDQDINLCFEEFRMISKLNLKTLKENGKLSGRPVSLAPIEDYNFILSKINYPTKISKLLTKMGLSTEDVIQVVGDGVDNVFSFVKQKSKL